MNARRRLNICGEFRVGCIGDNGGFLYRCCRRRPDFAGERAQRGHELFACRAAWNGSVAESPAASRERFGEPTGNYAALCIKLRGRNVFAPVVRQFRVYLVADERDAMLARPVRDGPRILTGKHAASRVAGRIDDQYARVGTLEASARKRIRERLRGESMMVARLSLYWNYPPPR